MKEEDSEAASEHSLSEPEWNGKEKILQININVYT